MIHFKAQVTRPNEEGALNFLDTIKDCEKGTIFIRDLSSMFLAIFASKVSMIQD